MTDNRGKGAYIIAVAVFIALGACSHDYTDTREDHGIDHKPLTALQTQIWVDPEGCDHWIIDDGLEGYMDARVRPDGTPVCRPGAIPETIANLIE